MFSADKCYFDIQDFREAFGIYFSRTLILPLQFLHISLRTTNCSFLGKFCQYVTAHLEIKHLTTTSYHPRTNGQAERFHKNSSLARDTMSRNINGIGTCSLDRLCPYTVHRYIKVKTHHCTSSYLLDNLLSLHISLQALGRARRQFRWSFVTGDAPKNIATNHSLDNKNRFTYAQNPGNI